VRNETHRFSEIPCQGFIVSFSISGYQAVNIEKHRRREKLAVVPEIPARTAQGYSPFEG